jgi:hypothetical protein
MIIACNDKNQKPTTKNETVTHQAELGCLNDKPKKSLNLDSVPADGCPVQ